MLGLGLYSGLEIGPIEKYLHPYLGLVYTGFGLVDVHVERNVSLSTKRKEYNINGMFKNYEESMNRERSLFVKLLFVRNENKTFCIGYLHVTPSAHD